MYHVKQYTVNSCRKKTQKPNSSCRRNERSLSVDGLVSISEAVMSFPWF